MPARPISVVPAASLREGLEAIRREAGVPERFPDDVLAEAEAARAEPRERVDIEFVTIDPPGARDLDQAMHIERAATAIASTTRSPTRARSSRPAARSTARRTPAP